MVEEEKSDGEMDPTTSGRGDDASGATTSGGETLGVTKSGDGKGERSCTSKDALNGKIQLLGGMAGGPFSRNAYKEPSSGKPRSAVGPYFEPIDAANLFL